MLGLISKVKIYKYIANINTGRNMHFNRISVCYFLKLVVYHNQTINSLINSPDNTSNTTIKYEIKNSEQLAE